MILVRINYKATMWHDINFNFYLNEKSKTLEGATSEVCSRIVRHRTLREALLRTIHAA